ncbi:MAG: phosphomannomutase/phosphoglucomutase [Kiritimatiellae bacterium]|nr:phosphomannomutase/phosphoglucomutase [Kiritimatiellia bacterium]
MAGIFKAYDIRGIYGRDLTEGVFYKIARAYVRFAHLKGGRIVVGRDCRKSSDALFAAFAKGANDEGANVIDAGLVSTPMSYFANASLGADGSVMITASHNTKEWNGCKLCKAGAVPISGATGIKDIERIVAEMPDGEPPAGTGTIEKTDISAAYAAHVKKSAHLAKPLHVAMDFANGMGIAEAAAFAGQNALTYDALFGEYDGDFPNHDANPLETETLADLQRLVRENPGKYAFGVAFDGDADRAGFIDEKGDIVPMDFMTALIAKDILASNPGAACFYDLRSSRVAAETIAAAGGRPMMSRVGHSFIKQQMRENDAVFAGELSGHYYFKANSTAESSSMAAYAVANIVSASGKTLSELVAPLRKYFQSGEINTRTSVPPAGILAKIKEEYSGKAKVFELDGVSIDAWDSEGWWANVRMSNTEPLVRLNLEGRTKETMEAKRDELLSKIRS